MDGLFRFHVSPAELFLRGTLIYWFLFLLFRFFLRRESGAAVGLADILVIVLIADAAQNGMSGEYKSVGEAMFLVGTIVGWNYLIDWMSFRYRWFSRFAEPRVLVLVDRGRPLQHNMRRVMLTMDELRSQLRESGVEKIEEVKQALLEPDGRISVIRYSQEESPRRKDGTPGAA